ncbi:VOC family protein [Ornithinimicrobium cerasi]|uniref:VOC family protein n=1 Tax=Ornithinimicrobium cerasi TaxID=2248773 RepID=UPI000F00A331|nr:VOC family protein [Ornithinimicrobium cerasi]
MPSHQLMFVNLPVADLARSRRFFAALGYPFDEDFCDEQALCLRLGPTLYAMLLRHDFFARFHDRRPAPPGAVGSLLCLSAASREAVDALVDRAVLAGGTDVRTEDRGAMYGRSYADPDGHVWEIMWMDPAAVRQEIA